MIYKHTPGPWRVSPSDDTVVIDARRNVVAAIDGDYNQPDTWPEMECNARLVAAAPDLLAALKDILPIARSYAARRKFSSDADLCGKAEAAIAKAEGR